MEGSSALKPLGRPSEVVGLWLLSHLSGKKANREQGEKCCWRTNRWGWSPPPHTRPPGAGTRPGSLGTHHLKGRETKTWVAIERFRVSSLVVINSHTDEIQGLQTDCGRSKWAFNFLLLRKTKKGCPSTRQSYWVKPAYLGRQLCSPLYHQRCSNLHIFSKIVGKHTPLLDSWSCRPARAPDPGSSSWTG